MKKALLIFALVAGFIFAGEANAQTPVVFTKGTTFKTISVTLPANGEKEFSVAVASGQVINVTISGDIAVSKTNEFPVVSVGLVGGEDGVDNWQDGEGYLSVLTGRKGKYVFTVANGSKRARTFKMKVQVTDNPDDYQGGIDQ